MIFNSMPFLIFFILFFILYWFVFDKNYKHQNVLILIGSYIFYAWADWRFLSFLIGISVLNYFLGIYIDKKPKYQRILLYIGLIQGVGGLAFFKYFNFFITSFSDAIQSLGINFNLHTLNIIIPLGISFFTFRMISYLLDIYNGKIKPTTDWIIFCSYVSFFPSLISGPIDKARDLIPQLEKKRAFDYDQATDGMRQILWGLFKKIVIADHCATATNIIFTNYQTLPASTLILGAFLYTIQIYADFSGYTDMAIGISRLIGLNITKNFDFPFFAQNIAEFWRRWHISLTSWLTEYVFTPLSFAFRYYGKFGLIAAIIITFTIIGIWHGPNWTYVLFGFLHGCYFIPLIVRDTMNKKIKIAKDKLFPSFKEFINILGTFTLVMLTTIIFRSENISDAFAYYAMLFSESLFTIPVIPFDKTITLITIFFIFIMLFIEWLQREKDHALQINQIKNPYFRLIIYYVIIITIIFFNYGGTNQFIYFKF